MAGTAVAKPKIGTGEVLAQIGIEASSCAGTVGCNGGFPEGVAIAGSRVFVAGPATFGTAGKGPSVVTVLRRSNGQLLDEIQIEGENTAFEHALSGIAVDANDNVYVLSTQLGVIRIERNGHEYTQTSYSCALPDLPICVEGGPSPCAPTPVDLPPTSNEMTFDDEGNLYLTDSTQATIYRVPPGGGEPEVWFQSPALAGSLLAPAPFGVNGIKVSPDRQWVYVTETFDPADPSTGHVYRIPLVESPAPEEMELVHSFHGFSVPDSLVFGRSGKLYVSLAGVSSSIAILSPAGDHIGTLQGPAGSEIPFDGPATMVFDDARKSLLVANHAIFGDPAHFAVLRVYVGERGDDQPMPCLD
ncbi:MAG: hypothetical protein IPK82_31635 [Polyangiaceae bacterium]|nr:hypothetical protein [Polyangiaceae bacterium]